MIRSVTSLVIVVFVLLFFLIPKGIADTWLSDNDFAEQREILAQLIQEERADDLRLLLQAVANAHWLQQDATKVRILHALASRCPTDIISTLTAHDGELLSSSEGTPFHHLAFVDSLDKAIECVDIFIQAGVDINAVDREGNTAMVSILLSHQEKTLALLEHLLANGADPSIRSYRGLDLMHQTLMLRLLYLPLLSDNEDDEFQQVIKSMVELTEQVTNLISGYFEAVASSSASR